MRLHNALFAGFFITLISTQAIYATECPRLTLNDFIQDTINIPTNPDLPILNPLPVYFIKKSVLEQNQMIVPAQFDEYPVLDGAAIDAHSNIYLAEVEWNSATKQITCRYEASVKNSSDEVNELVITTARKDISDPTQNTSLTDNNPVWTHTTFYIDNDYKNSGSSCDGSGLPIPSSACTWK